MDNGYTEAYELQSILNQHFHTVRPNLLLDRPMLGTAAAADCSLLLAPCRGMNQLGRHDERV
jgi:hypothetical protein